MSRVYRAMKRGGRWLLILVGARVIFDASLLLLGRPATWILAIIAMVALLMTED